MAAGRMAEPSGSLDEKIFHTIEIWHQFSILAAKWIEHIHEYESSHCNKWPFSRLYRRDTIFQ